MGRAARVSDAGRASSFVRRSPLGSFVEVVFSFSRFIFVFVNGVVVARPLWVSCRTASWWMAMVCTGKGEDDLLPRRMRCAGAAAAAFVSFLLADSWGRSEGGPEGGRDEWDIDASRARRFGLSCSTSCMEEKEDD